MSISNGNTRVIITVPKELKGMLEEAARRDNRSVSNLIVKILKDFVESHCEKEHTSQDENPKRKPKLLLPGIE